MNNDIQKKVEDIWKGTCGQWEACNEFNVKSFLSQCQEENIDPQYCFNWLREHSDKITNWETISNEAREWVIQHTSTGSPLSMSELDMH